MKTIEEIKTEWLREEAAAVMQGWDFSHIRGRYEEEQDLPWDYEREVRRYLRPDSRILDIDTGGGEFLLSLRHPAALTSATEGYAPNVQLCRKVLGARGIDFRPAESGGALPFADASFDLVLDRHADFNIPELLRVLKPGGVFVTQQVGGQNDRDLVRLLLPGLPAPYPDLCLDRVRRRFEQAGFAVLRGEEAFRPIRFYDVGALVWFARVIEWEFRGFSVERCLPGLLKAQRTLEQTGCIEGTIHRFLLTVRKP